MKILDDWINDLPFQFQDKKNINVLLKAFSKQLQEASDMFEQLNTLTDIDTAEGQNLDYVGTIIPISRAEASVYVGSSQIIDDDLYRTVLKTRLSQNVNNCTYYDLMQTFETLGSAGKFKYSEPSDMPATILLKTRSRDLTDKDFRIFHYPLDKAAGVTMRINYAFNVDKIIFYGQHKILKKVLNIYPAELENESQESNMYVGMVLKTIEVLTIKGEENGNVV